MNKTHTTIKQSMELAKILPFESADMFFPYNEEDVKRTWELKGIPCWSLAALLSIIKDKCGYFEFVYLKRTYDGRANPLEDVYRLSTDVYDVYNKEAIDACYELILKLHELKML